MFIDNPGTLPNITVYKIAEISWQLTTIFAIKADLLIYHLNRKSILIAILSINIKKNYTKKYIVHRCEARFFLYLYIVCTVTYAQMHIQCILKKSKKKSSSRTCGLVGQTQFKSDLIGDKSETAEKCKERNV